MLEIVLCIVLLPVAVVAATFTVALGAGIVKYFSSKVSEKVEN